MECEGIRKSAALTSGKISRVNIQRTYFVRWSAIGLRVEWNEWKKLCRLRYFIKMCHRT